MAPESRTSGGRSGETGADRDVVVVGGGPAGCSASVFTARYGLDTLVFDRGNASLPRCAHLQNYLGFPGGVDVDTFYELMHAHASEAGCEVVSELVESVSRDADGAGFAVETQDGTRVTASRVVAATRYGGEYLRPLDGEAMFETVEYGDDVRERFAPDYADEDGRTPVDGLYVAAPAGDANAQAMLSAGRGARVARALLADYRRGLGYPDELADHWDWLRREAELDDEWGDRDRWREWFDRRVPDDHDEDEARLETLRERDVDRRLETYLAPGEVDRRADRGRRRLVQSLGVDRVLDAIPDERIREYLAAEDE